MFFSEFRAILLNCKRPYFRVSYRNDSEGMLLPPWESMTFADGRMWGSVMLEVMELSQYVALPGASGICVRNLKPVSLSLQMNAYS